MSETPAIDKLNELLAKEIDLIRRHYLAVKQTEEAKRCELELERQIKEVQAMLQGVGAANDAFKEAHAKSIAEQEKVRSVDAKPKPSDKTRLTPSVS